MGIITATLIRRAGDVISGVVLQIELITTINRIRWQGGVGFGEGQLLSEIRSPAGIIVVMIEARQG